MLEHAFLTRVEQDKLAQANILVAGCGVGSWTAEALVRNNIGAEGNILLADPGLVTERNMPRQNFTSADLGWSKLIGLSQRLKSINPNVKLSLMREGITYSNVATVLEGIDLIADAIDVSRPGLELALHKEAQARKIPVVTGYDIGYGARTYAFDYRKDDGLSLEEYLGLSEKIKPAMLDRVPPLAVVAQVLIGPTSRVFETAGQVQQYYGSLLEEKAEEVLSHLPPEMLTIAKRLRNGELDYIPQTLEAAMLHGVMQAQIIMELILDHEVKLAPEYTEINLLHQIKKG